MNERNIIDLDHYILETLLEIIENTNATSSDPFMLSKLFQINT